MFQVSVFVKQGLFLLLRPLSWLAWCPLLCLLSQLMHIRAHSMMRRKYLLACFYVCLSISFCLHGYLSVSSSFLSVSQSVSQSVHLCVSISVCRSVCLSVPPAPSPSLSLLSLCHTFCHAQRHCLSCFKNQTIAATPTTK